MKISLVYPSRSRPEQCKQTLHNWINKKGIGDYEIILSLDEDDPELDKYKDLIYNELTQNDFAELVYTIYPNKSTVEAVNAGAAVSDGDIIIVISDDFDCPMYWHDTILGIVKNQRDYVLKVYDGLQEHIVTLPIMDRVYYERFGYVYCPEYKHLWADTDFTEVAKKLKRLIVRNDITFKHNHYSVINSQPDATYIKNEGTYHEGKAVFKERQKKRFGLDVIKK